jgi:hypothetical protein
MSFHTDGYDIVSPGLTPEELLGLRQEFPATSPNRRNLFQHSAFLTSLVCKGSFTKAATEILGANVFAVRAIFFNKIGKSNWLVPWHQDISIPVKQRKEVPGFTAFNMKEGYLHANAPAETLEQLVTLRIHLDSATSTNGALQLIPGSHRGGRQSDLEEGHRPSVQPELKAGEILRMRPLIFHASTHSISDTPRRVIHIEYAAHDLPGGLEWATKIG